jgi:hypothetical protein
MGNRKRSEKKKHKNAKNFTKQKVNCTKASTGTLGQPTPPKGHLLRALQSCEPQSVTQGSNACCKQGNNLAEFCNHIRAGPFRAH